METGVLGGAASNIASTVDAKIMADINTVKEKMHLCEKMLRPGDGSPTPSLKNNEALLGVIGFLEACAPRMVELVEAATQGALSEAVLMECLSVNDRLLKLLTDIDTYAFTETPATTTAASVPVKNPLEDEFDLLMLGDDSTSDAQKLAPVLGGKTTGEDDDDDLFAMALAPPASSASNTPLDPFGNEVKPASASASAYKTAPTGGLKNPPAAAASISVDPSDDEFGIFMQGGSST